MSFFTSSKIVYGSLVLGACAILCAAIVAQAQYNTYDSDSNSDSDGSPIMTQAELGKLVRNSAKVQAQQANQHNRNHQQLAAATRNLYNKQQPLQFDQSQFRQQRNYGSPDASLSGYGPVMGSASNGRPSEAGDDDEGSSLGPNFGANFDNNDNEADGEGSAANGPDGPVMNLNQAASGYPAQGDYNNDAGLGFNFGASGYGPAGEAEFGPSAEFAGEGRRAKSASSPSGSRGFGSEDDAGAPQYGPNSAINSGGDDDEGRAGYAPEGEGDNDDE